MPEAVLRAEHLSVEYAGRRPVRAVRDVSLELRRGEVLGIAGESGCGKSTLAFALARLLRPPARLTAGTVTFDGVDVLGLADTELRRFRWRRLSMVFQGAMNSLNPVTTIGSQFDDIFTAHAPEMDAAARAERTRELLAKVGIDPGRARGFAHELSGGMRQRIGIAMALALDPEVVIMDEPTTALDVVVQREILDEIERLREDLGFSAIFITHDLSLLLEISDRIAVMYAGQIVEYAPSALLAPGGTTLLAMPLAAAGPSPPEPSAASLAPGGMAVAPAHPYTRGLVGSFPDARGDRRELHGIPGSPPDLRADLVGCPFAPRCPAAFGPCRTVAPVLRERPGRDGWLAACHLHDPGYASAPEVTT